MYAVRLPWHIVDFQMGSSITGNKPEEVILRICLGNMPQIANGETG